MATNGKKKFNVVTVKEIGEKSFYTRIGVAFPLEKSPGFSVLFDALPTNGRVLIVPERGESPSEEVRRVEAGRRDGFDGRPLFAG